MALPAKPVAFPFHTVAALPRLGQDHSQATTSLLLLGLARMALSHSRDGHHTRPRGSVGFIGV